MATLIGVSMPSIGLLATNGKIINPSKCDSTTVLFFYPYTGKPGQPDPAGWDDIPGAHGSTPQALAFSKACLEFENLNVKIFGVSFQATDWQKEFVTRHGLRFPLLSDYERRLSAALDLETFRAGHQDYLVRRTIVVSDGIITQDFYPVPRPEHNATDVLKALQS